MKQLSDAEWRERLTPAQYKVLRQKGTEVPFSGELLQNTKKGLYVCGACGEVLFKSSAKFAAHCGWPSFYEPAAKKAVSTSVDDSHAMYRTEVTCSNCGSHLGHVFDDAPDQPGGLRYCINSLSLTFKEEDSLLS